MYENRLPVSGFTIINDPVSVKLQVESRRVRLDDSITPLGDNAWVYVKVPNHRPPGTTVRQNYLGPIVNVQKGMPCRFRWINTLPPMPGMPEMQDEPPVTPKPMQADMQASVGIAPHLHGGRVAHHSDGWPLAPAGYVGNPYGFPTERLYTYPNDQRAAMLWFHDHAMDNTAVQVYAGLAGLYFIRDPSDISIAGLIGGPQREIPLVIQDRMLDCGYERLNYWAGLPDDPANPHFRPGGFGRPEFLGETIFVNGRATPHAEVDRGIYRLRILNGSNARTYALALMDPAWWIREGNSRLWYSDRLVAIGNDGGLFTQPLRLAAHEYLLIAPGERLDVLLDLTDAALDGVSCLRLVNLAVESARIDTGPEAIFQTDQLSIPRGAGGNPGPVDEFDPSPCNALKLGQANVLQFCLNGTAGAGLDTAALEGVLSANATDDAFCLNGGVLGVLNNAPVARNRFVLLMNKTGDEGVTPNFPPHPVHPGIGWKDTQMWELAEPAPGVPTWKVPFRIDTAAANPPAGAPDVQTQYGIHRVTFFDQEPPPKIEQAGAYPAVHAPTYTPAAGTYERWYVANVGNMQDMVAKAPDNTVPDMHPFHMHLVNFVVLRRWVLDDAGQFVLQAPRRLDFDGYSRHDTVRVQSNELLELLVYFPPGYTGDYVYHCHLVEHEDMGMMLHFNVV